LQRLWLRPAVRNLVLRGLPMLLLIVMALQLIADVTVRTRIQTAMLQLKDEAFADPGDIRAALSAFRAVGLEDEARRIAIQLLILERRG
jgi:hypothetical protein